MRKSLFGHWSGARPAEQSEEIDDYGSLPDMEAAPRDHHLEDAHSIRLSYEELRLHPEGSYEAELVGCHHTIEGHLIWRFRRSEPTTAPVPELPRYVTGSVCRPGNHLHELLAALRVFPDNRAEMSDSKALADLLRSLDPAALIGERCGVRVEHRRDELGDAFAILVLSRSTAA